MKKLFPFLLLLISLISCQKKHQDVIEIYLTKERIPNNFGITLEEVSQKHFEEQIDSNDYKELYKIYDKGITYDTINKSIIYLGDFSFSLSDLENVPIITNDEIQGFDFKNSQILLKDTAIKKLSDLNNFHQFVILANNKPILNGYFENHFSSRLINTYFIVYYRNVENIPNFKVTESFNPLYLFQGTGQKGWEYPDFQTTNPEFYQAFQTRNKENKLFGE